MTVEIESSLAIGIFESNDSERRRHRGNKKLPASAVN
jgi:hypothetical protein